MKKVLFVTYYFGHGGAATVMKAIINYLINQGFEIILVSFLDDDKKYTIPSGVEYYYLKPGRLGLLSQILKLRKIIKKNKNVPIVSFEYHINMRTVIAKMFMKNKLIISERNDPRKSGDKRKHLRNFLYRFADILVCQTPDAKEYFPNYIQDKAIVIPNPIRDDLPERYTGERKKEIVTFSRITKQKNYPLLIDAFEIIHKEYSDYKLVIYGDGPEKEAVIKYIDEKKLSNYVEMKGFVNDLHEKIIDSMMFVSSSDYEGISNSMIEAMGIGLPTICTDCPCGGAKMIIENGINGFLTPVGDVNALVEKIKLIIDNKNIQNSISNNAIKVKDRLKINIIGKEWKKLLD